MATIEIVQFSYHVHNAIIKSEEIQFSDNIITENRETRSGSLRYGISYII